MSNPIRLTPVTFDDHTSPVTLHPSTLEIPADAAPVAADAALDAESASETEPHQTDAGEAAVNGKRAAAHGAGKG
jgi:hypothetical protein